jgi:hypothetical protein
VRSDAPIFGPGVMSDFLKRCDICVEIPISPPILMLPPREQCMMKSAIFQGMSATGYKRVTALGTVSIMRVNNPLQLRPVFAARFVMVASQSELKSQKSDSAETLDEVTRGLSDIPVPVKY